MTNIENNQTVSPTNAPVKVEAPKAKRILEPKQPKVAEETLQPIGEGEKATRATQINGDVATDTYSFRLVDKGPRYNRTTEFDFSGCTKEDLLNLALQSVRIDWQSQIRGAGATALLKSHFVKCNVKLDILQKQREAADPMVAAVRRLMTILNCTNDEAVAIITKEQAKRTGK
jgi:hypothetical protein